MDAQIWGLLRSGHWQLHRISGIRRPLTDDACKTLVQMLVISRPDYANTPLLGLPDYSVSRLRRMQDIAGGMIIGTPRSAHITPGLAQLAANKTPSYLPSAEHYVSANLCVDSGHVYATELLKRWRRQDHWTRQFWFRTFGSTLCPHVFNLIQNMNYAYFLRIVLNCCNYPNRDIS